MALVGQWLFDDVSLPGLDGSGTGNSAAFLGDATVSGGSAVFDGSGDYVHIPHNTAYDTSEFTVAFSFTADVVGIEQGLVSRDSANFDGGGHVNITIQSDGRIHVRHQSDTTSYTVETSSSFVTAGQTYEVTYAFGPDGGMQLFVDGTLVDTNTQPNIDGADLSLSNNDEPWTLGAAQAQSGDATAAGVNRFFDGSIDFFEIYTEELTHAELPDARAGIITDLSDDSDDGTVAGTGGDDVIYGGDSSASGDGGTVTADTIDAGAGNDTIIAGDGADTIEGGTGNDRIEAGDGDDVITDTGAAVRAPVLIASEDFESGATGWTDNTTETDATFSQFLGRFAGTGGAQTISKTYTLDGTMPAAVVEFDFYRLDSWDGEEFRIFVDDNQVFSQGFTESGDAQFFTNTFVDGGTTYTVTLTSSDEGVDLGFNSSFDDQRYKVRIEVDNPGATLKLGFGSTLDQAVSDESFGIDNVVVLSSESTDAQQSDIGNTAADSIDAGAGNDRVYSGAGEDTVYGGTGNDTLYAGTGNDGLYFGAGDDLVYGGAGNDYLDDVVGAQLTGINTIYGGDGNDRVFTGFGNDIVYGGDGVDIVDGEGDDDTIYGGVGEDIVYGGAGDDRLDGGDDGDLLFGGADQDEIDGGVGADTLYGGDGNDILDDTDVLATGNPGDTFYGGSGNDTLRAGFDADTFYGGDGTDTYDIDGSVVRNFAFDIDLASSIDGFGNQYFGIENIIGGTGGDTLSGDTQANILEGRDGADTLDGRGGADTLYGGSGDDEIQGGSGTDVLYGGSDTDVVQGGSGTDTLFGGAGNDNVNDDTGDGVVYGGDGDDVVFGGTSGTETLYGGSGQDALFGGSGGNDTLYGEDGDDELTGSTSNDTLFGGTGNDTLTGFGGFAGINGGDDTLYGGDGADTFEIEDTFGTDTVYGGEGGTDSDTLDLSALGAGVTVTFTGAEQGTFTNGTDTGTFFGIENIILTEQDDDFDASNDTLGISVDGRGGNDTLTGGAGQDLLYGGVGNDTLIGGGEADGIFGGTGNDVIYSGGTGSVVVDAGIFTASTIDAGSGDDNVFVTDVHAAGTSLDGGAGTDTIHFLFDPSAHGGTTLRINMADSGVTQPLNALAGDEFFQNFENVVTGSGNDSLAGNASNNSLATGAGEDSVLGGAGNDILSAGAGNDTLYGGSGNDTIYGGDDQDTIVIEASGIDGDTIYGGEGGTDSDTLDLSALGSGVTVTFTADEDGIFTDGTDTGTFFGIENIVLTDQDDDFDASNDTLGVSIAAQAGDDSVTGGSDGDTLDGGDGNDTLDGGSGNDTIYGGAGDDRIDGGSGNDNNILYGGAGSDEFTAIFGGNTFYGGDDGDVFNVGFGVDTIFGGSGGSDSDTLSGAGPDDAMTVTITGAESGTFSDSDGDSGAFEDIEVFELTTKADTVQGSGATSATTVLAGAGNDVVTTGSGADSIEAGDGDDTVFGGDGNDTIEGGAGDDQISTGAGGDSVDGGAGNDSIIGGDSVGGSETLLGGVGNDTIDGAGGFDIIYGGDGADVVADSGGSGSFDTIYAGSGADSIDAGQGRDVVFGGTGDDILSGGADNDTLTGGTGNDTFVLSASGGDDTITDIGTGNDQLDSSALTDAGNANTNEDGTVTADEVTVTGGGGSDQVLTFPSGETVTVPDGTVDTSTPAAQFASLVALGVPPCFAPGTLIATPGGPRVVEGLRVGDLIETADHGAQPLLWIGRREVVFDAQNPRGERDKPVQIKAGALGHGLPERDLVVSPQHRMVLEGPEVLAAFGAGEIFAIAKALTPIPGVRVMQGKRRVTYFALLLARHEVIFAEGAPTESFRPGPTAMSGFTPEQRRQITQLYPGLADDPETALGPMARPVIGRRAIAEHLRHVRMTPHGEHMIRYEPPRKPAAI